MISSFGTCDCDDPTKLCHPQHPPGDRPCPLPGPDQSRGTRRPAAADRGTAPPGPQRKYFRTDPECRHGLESSRGRPARLPSSRDPGRNPRCGWDSDRPGLPRGTLGDRTAHDRGGRGVTALAGSAVRRLCHRPVRRANPGHPRNDGQLALPQRRSPGSRPPHPLSADPSRRAGSGHLRQGSAGHDDGPGGLSRSPGGPGARRRDPAAHRRRRCRENPKSGRSLFSRRDQSGRSGRAGLPGLRQPGRRLPVPGDGGHGTGSRRSSRSFSAPQRPGPLGSTAVAGPGPPFGPGPGAARGAPFGPAPSSARRPCAMP